MAHLVVLILEEIEQGPAVLDAWEAAGVSGITVLNSTGLGRIRQSSYRDDFPIMPTLANFMQGGEAYHQTFFTVVDSEQLLERVLAVTQQAVGDLNRPHSGFLFVMPVSHAIGLRER